MPAIYINKKGEGNNTTANTSVVFYGLQSTCTYAANK